MKKHLILLFGAMLILTSCSSSNRQTASTNLAKLLPAELDGFTRLAKVKDLPADSLINYLGDVGQEYISYGVRQAASADYKKDNITYSVDLFEFVNPLGAFGIYAQNRKPEDRYLSLGTESLIGSGYIYYFKGRFYMTINSISDELPDLESLDKFGSLVDSLIPGVEAFPQQIFAFPDKRLIQHSQKFWPLGFNYYDVPESCFSADYERNGDICRLFYAENRPITEYETFKKLIQRKGRILTHMAGIGNNSIYAITDDYGKILLGYNDHIIYGVLRVSNDYWAKALCEALFENLGKQL